MWTNDGILLIWPLGTNFSQIVFEVQTFSLKKMQFKMPSGGKCRPFCHGRNVLSICLHGEYCSSKWSAYPITETNPVPVYFISKFNDKMYWKMYKAEHLFYIFESHSDKTRFEAHLFPLHKLFLIWLVISHWQMHFVYNISLFLVDSSYWMIVILKESTFSMSSLGNVSWYTHLVSGKRVFNFRWTAKIQLNDLVSSGWWRV